MLMIKEVFTETVWGRRFTIFLLAVIYGVIVRQTFISSEEFAPVSLSFLCGLPLAIGAIAVYLSPDEYRPSVSNAMQMGLLTFVFVMIAMILFNLELAICLVMAAPIFYGLTTLGALVMSRIMAAFGKKKKRGPMVNGAVVLALMLLPYLATPLESLVDAKDSFHSVESKITINAPPEVVWQHIIRVDRITEEEHRPSFYHLMGIPRPLEATLDHEGLGGVRQGYFEDGLSFREVISTWEPNQAVHFDIEVLNREALRAPYRQIGGQYLAMLDAGYTLEPTESGGTVLTLTSSYRMTTTFNAYGRLWADLIVQDFQSYLLGVIKDRAES